jgi:hypothetical protein
VSLINERQNPALRSGSRGTSAEPRPPGTELLDAETEPPNRRQRQQTSAETKRDQEPVAEIPAQTAYLNLTGKYPVRKDLDGGRTRARTWDPLIKRRMIS